MKIIQWVQICCLTIFSMVWTYGQTFSPWTKVHFDADKVEETFSMPSSYLAYRLNLDAFVYDLEARSSTILPLPDGNFLSLPVNRKSNFHPKLTEKYSTIRSFTGKSNGQPVYRTRISATTESITVTIHTPEGEVYIDPVANGTEVYYLVYYTRDYLPSPEIMDRIQHHSHQFAGASFPDFHTPPNAPFARNQKTVVELRQYDLALACTGEYTQKHGGTVEGALAAINVALDRINFLLETEVAITLRLIEDNDQLIFLDEEHDPFTNGNAGQMALENNNYLIEHLPTTSYDVGHVFGTLCNNVVGTSGGIGTVCGVTKGYGSSCEISTSDRFYIGIVCHELGHQFGARHTWNNCPLQSDNQFSAGTAFEPGSGTTLMAYAGACGNQNVQFIEDHYYHNNSITSINTYTRNGNGNVCAEKIPTDNMHPEVEILHSDGLTIPISTPFELTCLGSDPDGDPITYCWEQYDPGIGQAGMTQLGMPVGNAPIFRSSRPTDSPSRIFPALKKILNNQYDDTEVLPTYTRDLTFRVTVRDHRIGGGGTSWDEIRLKSTASAGPFQVTSFQDSAIIQGGSYLEVTWDVANTHLSPVSCQNVNVYLSTDGGFSFPIILAQNTPNDGAAMVTIPDVTSDSARIKIEADDNVFFDISDLNFTIRKPDLPTAFLDIDPSEIFVCLPESKSLQLKSGSISGFQDSIFLATTAPQDISVSINNGVIAPGDSSMIHLDFGNLKESGFYSVSINGITASGDTLTRNIRILATANDFSDLTLLVPGGSGVTQRPSFLWESGKNATAYVLEISGNPAFTDNVLSTGMTSEPEITLDTLLNENTLYFWRIKPYNACGFGDPSPPKAFHTINLLCETFNGSGLPQPLSQSATPTIKSAVQVEESGLISDVNIAEITGFHEAFNNLTFILESPDSTQITLISGACGFSSRIFTFGFDDQSSEPFDCRVSFRGQLFQPESPLELFNGEDRQGIWSLIVKDTLVGGGGEIDNWALELCGSVVVTPPELRINEGLTVDQNKSATITQELLMASSTSVNESQLMFRLVKATSKGQLLLDNQPLHAGDRFSQADVNSGLLSYAHQSQDTLSDHFDFVIQDEQGGWIDISSFEIEIRSTTVAVQQPDLQGLFSIFPNPSKGEVHLESRIPGKIWLTQLDGKIIARSVIAPGINYCDWSMLPEGIYLIRFAGNRYSGTLRLVIVK